MVLPAISFGVYNVLIFVPLLNAALAAKVIENSTDYSLNNTVRNMLFLPCTYEQKFAAKQAIDSFFVRMGDVLSAALVFAGTFSRAVVTRVRGGECRARRPRTDPGVACRALLQDADSADGASGRRVGQLCQILGVAGGTGSVPASVSGRDTRQRVKRARSVTAALVGDPARVAAAGAERAFFHVRVSLPERTVFRRNSENLTR